MKKLFFFSFIILTIVACSKELLPFPPQAADNQDIENGISVFSASKEKMEEGFLDDSPRLRTSLDFEARTSYSWNLNDKIGAVSTNTHNSFIDNFEFTLVSSSAGSLISNGVFTSDDNLVNNERYFFYYPHSDDAIVNGMLNFIMPTQRQDGNPSIANISGRDFMFSLDTLIAESGQSRLIESELDQIKFSHLTAFLHFSIDLPVNTTIYCLDLYSGNDVFSQKATLTGGDMTTRIGSEQPVPLVFDSNKKNSVPLYYGDNGYTINSSTDTLQSYLSLFPTDAPIGSVNVYLHTNNGTYIIPKNISAALKSNTRYKVTLGDLKSMTPISIWDGSLLLPPAIIDNEIFIYNGAHLAWISAISNGSITDTRITDNSFDGYTLVLVNNINLNGKAWTPINNFKGIFDGNGKSINGLYISTRLIDNNQGLFGINVSGTIKNTTLTNADLFSRGINIGGIVGNNQNGIISNCTVNNSKILGANYVGGIVGTDVNRGLNIPSCSVTGTTATGGTYNGLFRGFPNP